MCLGCWEEYGSPQPTEAAKALRPLIEAANGCGAMHIVVDDWNVEDDDIRHCMNAFDATEADKALGAALLALPEDQRMAAMAYADGYLDH